MFSSVFQLFRLFVTFAFTVSMLQKYLFPPAAPINNVTNSEKNRSLQQNYISMKQKNEQRPALLKSEAERLSTFIL